MTEKELMLELCTKYREELWYLPVHDLLLRLTIGEINPLRKVFFQEVTHYEDNAVNQSIAGSFISRFDYMPVEEKEQSLKELIGKCYVVIDEEELPLNRHRELVPQSAAENLFTQSIVGDLSRSSLIAEDSEELRKDRIERLLRFDPQIIRKLNNFSELCSEVRQQLREPRSLLWNLMLQFKAVITTFEAQSNDRLYRSDEQFKERYRSTVGKFVQFMMEILNCAYMLEKAVKHEGESTFITDQNLHTLVTSLLFEDEEFRRITLRVYEVSLAACIERFRGRAIKYQNTNRTNLFSPVNPRQEAHFQSLRMMDRVLSAPQPILKLKVLYEVNLRIMKDIRKQSSSPHEPAVTAQQLLNIITELMNRYEKESVVAQIIITRDFIHENYRVGKLGCVLAPFLAVIGYS